MRKNIFLTGVVLTVVMSIAGARAHQASTSEPEVNGFVGTWWVSFVIDDRPAGHALTTITADGIILTSNTTATLVEWGQPSSVVLQSLGHGAWVATGERTIDMTFVFLLSDIAGTDRGTRTIRGTLELDPSGNAWSGTYTATVAGASGDIVRVSAGNVEATRVAVEPMTAAGTPIAATPAT